MFTRIGLIIGYMGVFTRIGLIIG
ncbi:MAG: hypothetical protein J07HX64_00490 [halophilic archaeon J07HX64]|nr:MAG: hypothetical protein J07HX64_00490 [halophilic archaeon J07HX64]